MRNQQGTVASDVELRGARDFEVIEGWNGVEVICAGETDKNAIPGEILEPVLPVFSEGAPAARGNAVSNGPSATETADQRAYLIATGEPKGAC